MKELKWILVLTIMFCGLKPSSAQHEKGSGTIGIFNSASKLIGGNRDDGAIDPWMGLHIGYSISSRFDLELDGGMGWSRPRDKEASGIWQWIKLKPGTPYQTFIYPVILNLRFNLNPYYMICPYAIAGGGFLFWDLRDVSSENRFIPLPPSGTEVSGSQTNALFNLGIGFEIFLSEKLGLDVSGRYQRLLNQDKDMSGYNDIQSGNIEARVGLNFYFGGWADSDGDGIEDNTGNALYNLKLSQRRAASVRNYLVSNGIDSHRIRSRGFGQEQPIAPNATREGRAKNRRIEFIRIK